MTAAPTPGMAPKSTPKTDWRIIIFQRFKPSRAPRHTSRLLMTESGGATGRRAMERSIISGSAKKPSVTAMIGNLSQRMSCWNTKRGSPSTASPTVPNRTPSAPAVRPFTIAPALNAETMAMPKNAIAAISAKPKDRITGFMTGISIASTIAPMRPPKADTA